LATFAASVSVAPVAKEVEPTGCARVTEIGGPVMLITAVAILLVSAAAVAMIVTVPGAEVAV